MRPPVDPEVYARTHVKRVGECEVWQGLYRKGVTPSMSVRQQDGSRREMRVLDVRHGYLNTSRDRASAGRAFKNTCGTRGCVVVEHNAVHIGIDHSSKGTLTKNFLPAGPLLKRLDRLELDRQPEETKPLTSGQRTLVSKARRTGRFTVAAVDDLCITILQRHPYELYGQEFYTA